MSGGLVLLGMIAFVALSLIFGRKIMHWVGGSRREPTAEEWKEIQVRQGVQPVPTTHRPPPTHPIEMKVASAALRDKAAWIVGFLFGALCLFGDPSILWTRWLAWPVATAMLIFAVAEMAMAWSQWNTRLVASDTGVELRRGLAVDKSVRWEQVAVVRLFSYLAEVNVRQGTNAPKTTLVTSRTLALLDKSGTKLLEVPEPLRPEETYRMFLDAVPVWSSIQPTKEDIRGSKK